MEPSYPTYHLDSHLVTNLVLSALFRQRRSFQQDAKTLMRGVSSFKVVGTIPAADIFPRGCLLCFNHYFRPGFASWWMGLCLAATIPQEIKMVITSSFTYPDGIIGAMQTSLSKFALKRLADTYDFIGMPAMPPHPSDTVERTLAVRRIIAYARSTAKPLIGFAPEGGDSPDGRLIVPYPGVGRLLYYLSNQLGMTIQPAGIYEDDGTLWLRFGVPYCLEDKSTDATKEKETAISVRVMQSIAACLPERLWTEATRPIRT